MTEKGVSQPEARAELLAYLEEAADHAAFRNTADVEFLVHFIFDDHDFATSPLNEIGRTLVNEAEAKALGQFSAVLSQAIGPRERPLSALTAEDWIPVSVAARTALLQLRATATS